MSQRKKFSLGLDFGTNSVRALLVDIHHGFGTEEGSGNLFNVMKDLLDIRDRQRMGE
ncbi:MAG: hypothetical protein ACE5LC_05645 [Candidatus Aminicenantales bacterium]